MQKTTLAVVPRGRVLKVAGLQVGKFQVCKQSTASLDNLRCSICHSEYRVEQDHVNFYRKTSQNFSGLDRQMVRMVTIEREYL